MERHFLFPKCWNYDEEAWRLPSCTPQVDEKRFTCREFQDVAESSGMDLQPCLTVHDASWVHTYQVT